MSLMHHPSATERLNDTELLQRFEQNLLSVHPHSSLFSLLSTLRELSTRFYEREQYEASQFIDLMERAVDNARSDRRHLNGEFIQILMDCHYYVLGKLDGIPDRSSTSPSNNATVQQLKLNLSRLALTSTTSLP